MSDELPQYSLFPLGSVLFPGGPLPLRIFEPRYIDMVSSCMRNDEPFGVCLIQAGHEVGHAAEPFKIGTLARIVDWHRAEDGLLGITALGTERFRVHETHVQSNELLVGRCETLEDPKISLPIESADLGTIVKRLMQEAKPYYRHTAVDPTDAAWVSYRLSELMPLTMTRKQRLLEIADPVTRLDELKQILRALEVNDGDSEE